jgi:hypothetical protein
MAIYIALLYSVAKSILTLKGLVSIFLPYIRATISKVILNLAPINIVLIS